LAVYLFSFFQKKKKEYSKGQIMDISSWVFWVVLVIGIIIVVGFYLKSGKKGGKGTAEPPTEIPTSEEPPEV